jgi:hypothetical protein
VPATRARDHAALKSMLAPSSSLGVGMPVGPRRFIDRTPRKAALRPLPKPFRLLSFRGTGGQPWIGNSVPSSESEDSSLRPEELACFRELVRHDTITCWTQAEVDHPIHFFEQFVQCHHCGAQRFRITTETKCCRNGALILNDVQRLPEDLLDLMTGTSALWSHGVSKESRVLNNSFRFGQQVLPRIGGEVQTHVSDAYQHLRITGIPYTVVPNLNASSALRSYVDVGCAVTPSNPIPTPIPGPTPTTILCLSTATGSGGAVCAGELVQRRRASHVRARQRDTEEGSGEESSSCTRREGVGASAWGEGARSMRSMPETGIGGCRR